MYKVQIYILILSCMLLAMPSVADENSFRAPFKIDEVLTFETMYAVDGAFLTPQGETNPNIRGIVGDYQAWKINKFIKGQLFSNGWLIVKVRGLVFPNAPNDETFFRALVSCQTENGGQITTQNVTTAPFPTGPQGNADIKAHLQLPSPCVAPIIMILNGNPSEGDTWFAMSGFEGI